MLSSNKIERFINRILFLLRLGRGLSCLHYVDFLFLPSPKHFYNVFFLKNMFKIFDHTADIGIEAFGETLEEAFEETARGMFAIITDGSKIEKKEKRKIEIPFEGDEEILLVDWLSELIYIHDVETLVFSDFDVKINDVLTAYAYGEKYDRNKHKYGVEIKAVTYHMLEIKRNKKGVTIKVLFDI